MINTKITSLSKKWKVLVLGLSLLLGFLLLKIPRPHFVPVDPIAFTFGWVSIALSAIFFLHCLINRIEDIQMSPVDVAAGATVAVTALSYLFLSRESIQIDRCYIVFATFVFYLLLRFSYKRYLFCNQTIILLCIVGISGVEGLYGLIQWLSSAQIKGHFYHSNYFAMYAAMHVPLALALIWSKEYKLPQQIYAVFVMGLLVFCVSVSKCRTAYLGLTPTLLFMIFVYYGPSIRRMNTWISKYFSLIYGLIGGMAFVLVASTIFTLKPLSAIGRILVWKVSLYMFLDAPIIGVGFGKFPSVYNIYQAQFFEHGMGTATERVSATGISEAFNSYLESTVEFGILGVIVFAVLWIMVLRHVRYAFVRFHRLRGDAPERRAYGNNHRSAENDSQIKTPTTSQHRGGRPTINDTLTLGMAGSVLLFMIMALFYSVTSFTSIYLIYTVCLASVVSANQRLPEKDKNRHGNDISKSTAIAHRKKKQGVSHTSRRLLLVGFSSMALIVSITRIPAFYDRYKAGRYWYAAHRLSETGPYDTAIEFYRYSYPDLRRDAHFLYDFGIALLQARKQAEAVNMLEQSKEIWPDPFLLEDLALAYENIGNLNEAIKNATLASHILPWRLTSKCMLADLYYQRGDTENALKYAQDVVDTPMKKVTEKGRAFKTKAQIIQQTLKSPLQELRRKRERVFSLIPVEYQSEVMDALAAAGSNDMQLIEAINTVEPVQRRALSFLLVNMPRRDLKSLTADFLVSNVEYACKTRSAPSYNMNVPDEIFLNYVLPYANLNERRDNWRADFYERFIGVARNCSSAEETATALNTDVFRAVHVGFGERDLQELVHSPFESIEKGYASCEGLSILLVDACRAVGIPARLVFIPEWVDVRGGHVWVEIFDNGRWQCMAALDTHDPTWPCKRASRTDPSKLEHRIYAVSFKRTELNMVFGPEVFLIDVTDRYIHQENTR